MKPEAHRVVFDTNTFISAFVFGGIPEQAYRYALRGSIELVASPPILQETGRILKDKMAWEDDKTERVLKQIARVAIIVRPKQRLAVIKDEPDNRILEAAVEGEADFIVSGDKDLLSLGDYQGIQIITVSELVSKIK